MGLCRDATETQGKGEEIEKSLCPSPRFMNRDDVPITIFQEECAHAGLTCNLGYGAAAPLGRILCAAINRAATPWQTAKESKAKGTPVLASRQYDKGPDR